MTAKSLTRDLLARLWYPIRPLEPRFRSREAFIASQGARGLNGDGTPKAGK